MSKEAFVRANAVLQMTQMVRKPVQMLVELPFLGPGVEIPRANQESPPQFAQQLDRLREAGVHLSICEMSLESLGLTRDQMLEAEPVKGGVEVSRRIQGGCNCWQASMLY